MKTDEAWTRKWIARTEEHIGVPEMSEPFVSQPMSEREKFMPDVDLSELTEEQQKLGTGHY